MSFSLIEFKYNEYFGLKPFWDVDLIEFKEYIKELKVIELPELDIYLNSDNFLNLFTHYGTLTDEEYYVFIRGLNSGKYGYFPDLEYIQEQQEDYDEDE